MNFPRNALLSFPLLLVHLGCNRDAPQPAPATTEVHQGAEPFVLRVGHFPNVTHAQGLIAHAMTRRLKLGQGSGWFEERLGPGVKIDWFVYNAGPSAMEALFANSIDITYVGPSPALNAYIRSKGEEVRVIAGAAEGGAALVVQGDGRMKSPQDFKGRKIATPQLGNTQDVACRAWLVSHRFKVTQLGGDVQVIPTANPDQLSLFQRKAVDAVWTVEPWVSRLEIEAGGSLFLEEPDAVTTLLVSSAKFLRERRELARRFFAAHAELTRWISANPEEAQKLVAEELKAETSRPMPQDLLSRSWKRLKFTSEIRLAPLEKFVAAARSVGFLRDTVELSRLLEVP